MPTKRKREDYDYIEVDGAGGGGQLIRYATALSALTQKPMTMARIREERMVPGLKSKHVAGIKLVAKLSNAQINEIDTGSSFIDFEPGIIQAGNYECKAKMSAPIALIYQNVLPCLLFPETYKPDLLAKDDKGINGRAANVPGRPISTLCLYGGTNIPNAPLFDYVQRILLPFLNGHFLPKDISFKLDVKLRVRGFYDICKGDVLAFIPGLKKGEYLRPVRLTERGRVKKIHAICYSCTNERSSTNMSTDMKKKVIPSFRKLLPPGYASSLTLAPARQEITDFLDSHGRSGFAVETTCITISGANEYNLGCGAGILLWAETNTGCVLASDAHFEDLKPYNTIYKEVMKSSSSDQKLSSSKTLSMKEKTKKMRESIAEHIVLKAATRLIEELERGGCVDEYMQDQLLIFSALAKGMSVVRTGPISEHTRVAMSIIMTITGAKFKLEEYVDGTRQSIIYCQGIGLEGRL